VGGTLAVKEPGGSFELPSWKVFWLSTSLGGTGCDNSLKVDGPCRLTSLWTPDTRKEGLLAGTSVPLKFGFKSGNFLWGVTRKRVW
jgi:hypothetical protein